MQDLKAFMEEHKDAFDDAVPSTEIWGKIDAQLPKQEATIRIMLVRVARVAAILLVVFGLGVWASPYLTGQNDLAVEMSDEATKEYQELEDYYALKVNEKMTELKAHGVNTEMTAVLAELEAAFEEWKTELGENTTDEDILNIMISNYQLKIETLEKLILKIQDAKPKTSKI